MGGSSDTEWWAQLKTGTYSYTRGCIEGAFGIEMLAYSLSWTIRYNGHLRFPWSVAAHAVLVAEIIAACGHETNAPLLLRGLHHDDHESLVGDMNNQLKGHLSGPFAATFEHECKRAQFAIERKINIHSLTASDDVSRRVVKAADIAALEVERRRGFVERKEWATEKIVDPAMLAAGERIFENSIPLPASGYGPAAAERYLMRHNTIMQRFALS